MKQNQKFCLYLLAGGICIFTIYMAYFSLFPDKSVEQLYYENRKDFESVASYLINNEALPILVESRNTWPQELEDSLQNIVNEKPSVTGIFYDAKLPDVLHFSFPSKYQGKDGENADIWISQELVYSKSGLSSVFLAELVAPTGVYYYSEQVEKIEENWYIGSYRVY